MARIRFISPDDLGAIVADLRLAPTRSQGRLLEFLERQRIVVPVARVRWPRAMVIESRGYVPEPPPTHEERSTSLELSDALQSWRKLDADPELEHPFDRGDQAPGASLLTLDVAGAPFEQWSNFRINVRPAGETPVHVPDAVDTYYHAWQVLLVADALDMGVRLVFDTRRQDLMRLALSGDIRNLPDGVAWSNVSFIGPRGLADGLRWSSFLDASARTETIRVRKLSAITLAHHGQAFVLAGAELEDFRATVKRAASRALNGIGATSIQTIEFLTYLCERWREWKDRARQEVAEEYKRQLLLACNMIMSAQDRDFAGLAADVGHVTGHFENALDVIFPDWTKHAREQAELSLRHSVVAKAPIADATLALTDSDVTDVLDWLDRLGAWKIHLSIEAILLRQFKSSTVDLVALAKEVESISATFEHLVNSLLDEAGVTSNGTLMKKLQRLWNTQSEVHSVLTTHHGLVSTNHVSRSVQLSNIAALSLSGPNADVARTQLSAVLYRNDGMHNGMSTWPEAELHEATRVFLTAIMFCRRNFMTSPPTP